jgi:hypothetical protein
MFGGDEDGDLLVTVIRGRGLMVCAFGALEGDHVGCNMCVCEAWNSPPGSTAVPIDCGGVDAIMNVQHAGSRLFSRCVAMIDD